MASYKFVCIVLYGNSRRIEVVKRYVLSGMHIVLTVTFICVLFVLLGQYAEAKADLQLATDFLKDTYVVELHDYTGDNVHYILDMLRPPRLEAVSTSRLRSPPEVVSDDVVIPTSGPSLSELYGTLWRRKRNPQLKRVSSSPPETVSSNFLVSTSGPSGQVYSALRRRRRSERRHAVVDNENGRYGKPEPEVNIVALEGEPGVEEGDVTYRSERGWNETAEEKYAQRYTYVTRLIKIAHGLHYIGIGILAVFVVQVSTTLSLSISPYLSLGLFFSAV